MCLSKKGSIIFIKYIRSFCDLAQYFWFLKKIKLTYRYYNEYYFYVYIDRWRHWHSIDIWRHSHENHSSSSKSSSKRIQKKQVFGFMATNSAYLSPFCTPTDYHINLRVGRVERIQRIWHSVDRCGLFISEISSLHNLYKFGNFLVFEIVRHY